MKNKKKSTCKVDQYGNKYWYLNGLCHRENDLPAVEGFNGTKEWFINGKLHRENDKPAIEYFNGDKYWCLNDKLHREKGPAIEYTDNTKKWYWNGEEIKVNSQEEFEEKLLYLKFFLICNFGETNKL